VTNVVIHYHCRKSLLAKLNKKFEIPSARKPPPTEFATQAVLEKIVEDPAQANGVGTISTLLSNKGILLPRYRYFIALTQFRDCQWAILN